MSPDLLNWLSSLQAMSNLNPCVRSQDHASDVRRGTAQWIRREADLFGE